MKSKVLSAIATGLAVLAFSAGTALAWTFNMSGTGNCLDNGKFHIVWTINNSTENEPLTITSSSNTSVVSNGTQIPANKSSNFTQDVNGSQVTDYSLTVSGHWVSDKNNVTQTAKVKVTEPCTQPTPPAYTCDSLGLTAEDNRTVKITAFNTTATNGAVFKNASINWGDNSAALTTNSVIGQTHQYSADGTYNVSATAFFTVNGKTVSNTGPACVQTVTFKSTTPPTVTPPPTTLVNTGSGNIAAIFGAATVAGAGAYHWLISRRLAAKSTQ